MKSEKDKYIEERYAEYQKKWAENPPRKRTDEKADKSTVLTVKICYRPRRQFYGLDRRKTAFFRF